jgi:hypothetical protein
LVTKQTCDWLPQPQNCNPMQSVPTKDIAAILPPVSRFSSGICSRNSLAPSSPDNEKSSPQILSLFEHTIFSSLLLPTGAEAETNPKSSRGFCRPHNSTVPTRPSGLALLYRNPFNPNDNEPGFLVRDPIRQITHACSAASAVELRTPKGL